jgi:FkbM family methyltransferase
MMKNVLKHLFAMCGFQIQRLPRQSAVCQEYRLNFGSYTVVTDSEALAHSYATYPETNQVIPRLCRLVGLRFPTSGVIDIGANCGDTAALMRSACDLPILCIEGDPHLLAMLRRNTAALPRITVVDCYLGESTCTLPIEIRKEGWNNTLVLNAASPKFVRLIRLDELDHPWLAENQVSFLKCDAEGFDVAIILGARGLLDRDHPILLFEYNRENMAEIGEPGMRIFDYLREMNYGQLAFYDAYGRYLLAADIKDRSLLADLHDYADGVNGKVYYYDIVAFPRMHQELADEFIQNERDYRISLTENLIAQ